MRVGQRIADSRLSRQVDHRVGGLLGEQPFHRGTVGDVGLEKMKPLVGQKGL
jgi:hypothetical protein